MGSWRVDYVPRPDHLQEETWLARICNIIIVSQRPVQSRAKRRFEQCPTACFPFIWHLMLRVVSYLLPGANQLHAPSPCIPLWNKLSAEDHSFHIWKYTNPACQHSYFCKQKLVAPPSLAMHLVKHRQRWQRLLNLQELFGNCAINMDIAQLT